jgi:hypothetical protein
MPCDYARRPTPDYFSGVVVLCKHGYLCVIDGETPISAEIWGFGVLAPALLWRRQLPNNHWKRAEK